MDKGENLSIMTNKTSNIYDVDDFSEDAEEISDEDDL